MAINPKIKQATFSDIDFLWYLRNQSDIYLYSKISKPVFYENHLNWIIPILLGQKEKRLYVIWEKGLPVGSIRYDFPEISIAVLLEFRGKGIAAKALKYFRKIYPKMTAEIHKDNVVSIKLFEGSGFKFVKKKGIWLNYKLSKKL